MSLLLFSVPLWTLLLQLCVFVMVLQPCVIVCVFVVLWLFDNKDSGSCPGALTGASGGVIASGPRMEPGALQTHCVKDHQTIRVLFVWSSMPSLSGIPSPLTHLCQLAECLHPFPAYCWVSSWAHLTSSALVMHVFPHPIMLMHMDMSCRKRLS